MKRSQTSLILESLMKGERLNPIIALDRFKCFRLSGRVKDCRNAGYNIKSQMITVPSGKRVAEYWLDPNDLLFITPNDHKKKVSKMSEWQSIDTAPKDGTRILVWVPFSDNVLSVYWDEQFEQKWDEEKDETINIGAWTDDAVQSFGYEEKCSYRPTYWMPLPDPPVFVEGK